MIVKVSFNMNVTIKQDTKIILELTPRLAEYLKFLTQNSMELDECNEHEKCRCEIFRALPDSNQLRIWKANQL